MSDEFRKFITSDALPRFGGTRFKHFPIANRGLTRRAVSPRGKATGKCLMSMSQGTQKPFLILDRLRKL